MSINEDIEVQQRYNKVIPEYNEPIIGIQDEVKWIFKNPRKRIVEYLVSLFPIAQWIYRYNLTWLTGDLIAGLTVGVVVVPQGMSYAKIAGLPVQYGLYSSFIGVIMYPFFATSKDVTIGPVAVMSAETYKIVHRVLEKMPELTADKDGPAIAATLALLCGGITAGIGFLRLGFLLEYIAMPCVLGFMSGSAFTIIIGQVPTLFGISKLFDTRAASYHVAVNCLKHLHQSTLDAAFGLVCLLILTVAKLTFEYLGKRDPKNKRLYFFLSTLRSGVVIIFSTLIAWGVCHHEKYQKSGNYPISILKTVPRGLTSVGVHPVNVDVVNHLASELPIATVILLLEHISISKSFGRINGYRINPNQELIAIGATNLIGHFFDAYPATGSFSRTAIKSKAGVRTPLAGIFTGVCVLVAIYGLTSAFFWISNAALAAIIIHAVVDLIASWQTSWNIWLVSPVEFIIFVVDVFLCVFVTIESGIYFSIAASAVFLLLRISFPVGEFLGKVEYNAVNDPTLAQEPTSDSLSIKSGADSDKKGPTVTYQSGNDVTNSSIVDSTESGEEAFSKSAPLPSEGRGLAWLPLRHQNVNPSLRIVPPPPGIFVYRLNESLTYPNVARQMEHLIVHIKKHCRPDVDTSRTVKLGDRPWNDNGPRHRKLDESFVDTRPYLRAVVIDLSSTPAIDFTAVQQLSDARDELEKFANRPIEFHFAGILSPWTRRALLHGFARVNPKIGPKLFKEGLPKPRAKQFAVARSESFDIEGQFDKQDRGSGEVPILSTDAPYLHVNIPDLQ